MRFIRWNLLFATWLLLSAFLFTQTPLASTITFLAAIAVMVLAVLSGARPAVRYAVSALTVALGFTALLLPDVSGAARLNLALTAALLFAVSLVSPTHHQVAGAT